MSDRTIGVGILGTGFARTTQIPCFQATSTQAPVVTSFRAGKSELNFFAVGSSGSA